MKTPFAYKRSRFAAGISLVGFCLSLSPAGSQLLRSVSGGGQAAVISQESLARKLAGDSLIGNFDPSLNQRENVDFLLTPALLIQEAISKDVLLTYPGE